MLFHASTRTATLVKGAFDKDKLGNLTMKLTLSVDLDDDDMAVLQIDPEGFARWSNKIESDLAIGRYDLEVGVGGLTFEARDALLAKAKLMNTRLPREDDKPCTQQDLPGVPPKEPTEPPGARCWIEFTAGFEVGDIEPAAYAKLHACIKSSIQVSFDCRKPYEDEIRRLADLHDLRDLLYLEGTTYRAELDRIIDHVIDKRDFGASVIMPFYLHMGLLRGLGNCRPDELLDGLIAVARLDRFDELRSRLDELDATNLGARLN